MPDYNAIQSLLSAFSTAVTFLGFEAPWRILLPSLIAPMLYAGPLYVSFLSYSLPFQRLWSYENNLKPLFTTYVGWRNYIVVSTVLCQKKGSGLT